MNRCFVVLLILSVSCCLEKSNISEDVVIMSWNVQNLFDGTDNGQEYDDFSVSSGNWSEALYRKRIKNIIKVIKLNNPDVLGLQEIEGIGILEDIKVELPEYKYIVSTNYSGAIQQGFLSKSPILRTGYIYPSGSDFNQRPLLEITLNVMDQELTIINNHWKSKIGDFSEHLRIESSTALKKRLLELNDKDVVVLGDLNENYNEYQKVHKSYDTAIMFKSQGSGITISNGSIEPNELYTPWADSEFKGSYLYKGEWETIDHILLNYNLMDNDGATFEWFKVDNRDLLFDNSGNIKKWYTDFQSGYSDHLPILLKLHSEGIITTLE